MKPIYYGEFEKYSDLRDQTSYGDKVPLEDSIIYAGYTYESYDGSALIVFVKDGELWENHDGHCSCYGLEDWSPEKGEIEATKKYKGWPGLLEALEAWEKIR